MQCTVVNAVRILVIFHICGGFTVVSTRGATRVQGTTSFKEIQFRCLYFVRFYYFALSILGMLYCHRAYGSFCTGIHGSLVVLRVQPVIRLWLNHSLPYLRVHIRLSDCKKKKKKNLPLSLLNYNEGDRKNKERNYSNYNIGHFTNIPV